MRCPRQCMVCRRALQRWAARWGCPRACMAACWLVAWFPPGFRRSTWLSLVCLECSLGPVVPAYWVGSLLWLELELCVPHCTALVLGGRVMTSMCCAGARPLCCAASHHRCSAVLNAPHVRQPDPYVAGTSSLVSQAVPLPLPPAAAVKVAPQPAPRQARQDRAKRMAYLAAYQVCEPPEPSKWELVAEGEEEVVGLGKQLAASSEAEDQALAQQVRGAAGCKLWPVRIGTLSAASTGLQLLMHDLSACAECWTCAPSPDGTCKQEMQLAIMALRRICLRLHSHRYSSSWAACWQRGVRRRSG